eukprot:1157398-Pelagomonas_calceolata.AAC.9
MEHNTTAMEYNSKVDALAHRPAQTSSRGGSPTPTTHGKHNKVPTAHIYTLARRPPRPPDKVEALPQHTRDIQAQ